MILSLYIGPEDLPRSKAGRPALPRKNDYWRIVKTRDGYPRLAVTDTARTFRDVVSLHLRARRRGVSPDRPYFAADQSLSLWVHTFAGRQSKGRPLVDSDACLSPVKDALTHAGAWYDDAQVGGDMTTRSYRKGRPGIAVMVAPTGVLWEIPPWVEALVVESPG